MVGLTLPRFSQSGGEILQNAALLRGHFNDPIRIVAAPNYPLIFTRVTKRIGFFYLLGLVE